MSPAIDGGDGGQRPAAPRPPAPGPPCRLPALLESLPLQAGTRFQAYATHPVPADHDKRALLLLICGYDTRTNGDLVEVRASGWVPTLTPTVEPMTSYLRKTCALIEPQHLMDPNDARLDTVFGAA